MTISLSQIDKKNGAKWTQTDISKIDTNSTIVQSQINSDASNIETIKNQLEDILNPLAITLSLSTSVVELGSTVNSQTLTWTTSKDIASQTLNGTSINKDLRTTIFTISINSDITYILNCTTEGGKSVSVNKTLSFVNGIFVGKSLSITYNSDLINSLTKTLSEDKNKSYTVTTGENEYIYLAYPKRLGISTFSVNGLIGGFELVNTISYANSSGYEEDYYLYRSDNVNLSTTTFTVSQTN